MAKKGRKDAYETKIVPFFNEITKWLENGATERQIAENLGIAYSTFNKYKATKTEFMQLLKNGRRSLVTHLRGALIKKAMGFNYTETKTVSEHVDLPAEIREFLLDNGFTREQIEQAQMIKTEVVNKHAAPDVAALNLALKNYDKDNWSNDWQTYELRKRELELKEKKIDDEWT